MAGEGILRSLHNRLQILEIPVDCLSVSEELVLEYDNMTVFSYNCSQEKRDTADSRQQAAGSRQQTADSR